MSRERAFQPAGRPARPARRCGTLQRRGLADIVRTGGPDDFKNPLCDIPGLSHVTVEVNAPVPETPSAGK